MQRVLFLPDWCYRPFSTDCVRKRHIHMRRATYLWPDDDGSIILFWRKWHENLGNTLYYAAYRHATAVDINSKRLAFASDEKEALRKFQCRFHSQEVYRKKKEIRETKAQQNGCCSSEAFKRRLSFWWKCCLQSCLRLFVTGKLNSHVTCDIYLFYKYQMMRLLGGRVLHTWAAPLSFTIHIYSSLFLSFFSFSFHFQKLM